MNDFFAPLFMLEAMAMAQKKKFMSEKYNRCGEDEWNLGIYVKTLKFLL
jgi:hypothetical protein